MATAGNALPGMPHVESPFCARLFDAPGIDVDTRRIALQLARDGFAVIDFPEPDFDAVAARIRARLAGHYDFDGWRAQGHRAGTSLRVQDAWAFDEDVRRIACNEQVVALLSRLYGRAAWPFQTLNFRSSKLT